MLGYTHPGQTPPCPVHAGIDVATAADGTHPTGMHSCWSRADVFQSMSPTSLCEQKIWIYHIYRPQRSWGKVMFLQASVILLTGGGVRGFIWGGVRGFIRGACVVLFGGRAWFYSGGVRGFIQGGREWFYSGGHAWFYSRGACVVLFGGACVVLFRGVRGFIGGACVVLFRGGVRGFSSFCGYNEIRSMSGWYASYWNAFLLLFAMRASVDIENKKAFQSKVC